MNSYKLYRTAAKVDRLFAQQSTTAKAEFALFTQAAHFSQSGSIQETMKEDFSQLS
jgi:hypothetical protein